MSSDAAVRMTVAPKTGVPPASRTLAPTETGPSANASATSVTTSPEAFCPAESATPAASDATSGPGSMTVAQRRRLTAVARGAAPADLYVRGGTLLNVYTGEIYPANVAIAGERIAYVGLRDDMVGPRTRTLDAGGRVV